VYLWDLEEAAVAGSVGQVDRLAWEAAERTARVVEESPDLAADTNWAVLLHKGQPCLDTQGSHQGHRGRLDHQETHPEDQTFGLETEDTVHTEEDTVRLARN
jgi:hypothetical protein